MKPINPVIRAAMIAGGLCMMIPCTLTDVIGLAVFAASFVLLRSGAKKTE